MMEVQQILGYPLFQNIDSSLYSWKTIQADMFFLEKNCQNPIFLTLLERHITISQEMNQPMSYVPLDFDLKFNVLYETANNLLSQKIGIQFSFTEKDRFSVFTTSRETMKRWIDLLSDRIHQRGFHEMFKPIKKLGKGNFASVYQVQRVTDGKRLAVKAFSKANAFSAKNGKESLKNELSILRLLKHRNLLNLQCVYESENSLYVVIGLLKGGALFNKIQDRKGIFSESEVKTFMRGLLLGLAELHQLRIVHRDLKPQNIMFLNCNEMDPVIVDFGLATNVDLQQYLFFRCGTPGYVAPEIIELSKCQHVEPQCDIFSAGVIFHILLTGKPVFDGSKYQQVYQNNKKMNINFEKVQSSENFSPQALDLLKKMLLRDPCKRIKATEALEHDYLKDESIQLMGSCTTYKSTEFNFA